MEEVKFKIISYLENPDNSSEFPYVFELEFQFPKQMTSELIRRTHSISVLYKFLTETFGDCNKRWSMFFDPWIQKNVILQFRATGKDIAAYLRLTFTDEIPF